MTRTQPAGSVRGSTGDRRVRLQAQPVGQPAKITGRGPVERHRSKRHAGFVQDLVDQSRAVGGCDHDRIHRRPREDPSAAGRDVDRKDRTGGAATRRVGDQLVTVDARRGCPGPGPRPFADPTRVDDPNPAGGLAARLDGQPIARNVPRELRGEGPSESIVSADRFEHSHGRRGPVDRARPDAEIRSSRPIDSHLVDGFAGRIDGPPPDDGGVVVDVQQASADHVDGRQS